MSLNARPARIAGWIPIRYRARGGSGVPRMGGLVEISRTGARLYLNWKCRPGDRIPLVLRMPGETVRRQFYMRVVWVLDDEPGRIEAFEARLEFLRDLVREGLQQTRGLTYGYLCGVKFEAGMKLENVRAIQQRFEREASWKKQTAT